jgi:peptidylprolyl isomerase
VPVKVTVMRKASKIVLVAVAAVALGACSPSKEEPSDLPPGTDPTPTGTSAMQSAPPSSSSTSEASSSAPSGEQGQECTAEDIEVSGEFGQQPEVTIPDDCAAPTSLVIEDLEPGTGAEVTPQSDLQADYHLVSWRDKQMIESSFGKQPLAIENLGSAGLIPGWKQGLVGMKEGGRRLLVIPPDLAYGEQQGTLVFVIDAVEVTG